MTNGGPPNFGLWAGQYPSRTQVDAGGLLAGAPDSHDFD